MLVDYVRVYQGDWTELSGEEAYVASAEGVVALISDDYPMRPVPTGSPGALPTTRA